MEKLIEALAIARGEVIAAHGAAAANAFGLTTQVPVRSVFLTSGRCRTVTLGEQRVELRYAPAWQLMLPGHPAGDAIRGLAWLGEERAAEALPHLRRRLSPSALAQLAEMRPGVPTWLAAQISRLVADG